MHPIKQRILQYEEKYGFNLEARRAFNQAIQGGGNPFSWFGNKVKSWLSSKPSNSATYTKSDLFKSPDVTDTNEYKTQQKHKQNEKRLHDPTFNESPSIDQKTSYQSPFINPNYNKYSNSFINPNYNKSSNPFINPNYNKSSRSFTPQRHQRNQQNFINPQNKASTPRTSTTPITRAKTDPDLIDLTKIRQIPAHKFQRTPYSTKKPNIIDLSKIKNLPSKKPSQTSYVTNNPKTIDLSKIKKSISRMKPSRLPQTSTLKPRQRFRSQPKQIPVPKPKQRSVPTPKQRSGQRFKQSNQSKPFHSTNNPNKIDLGTAYRSINSRKRSAPPHLQPKHHKKSTKKSQFNTSSSQKSYVKKPILQIFNYVNNYSFPVWYFKNKDETINGTTTIQKINHKDRLLLMKYDINHEKDVIIHSDTLSLINEKPNSKPNPYWIDSYNLAERFNKQQPSFHQECLIKAIKFSFATKPTKGQGDCLLYAIIQYHLLHTEIPKLFDLFITYDQQGVKKLRRFLFDQAVTYQEPEHVRTKLKNMGEWLTDAELPFIAEALNITILVNNETSKVWSMYGVIHQRRPKIYIINQGATFKNKSGGLVTQGIHYETLLPKERLLI